MEILCAETFNVSAAPNLGTWPVDLIRKLDDIDLLHSLTMERYVSYKNVMSSETENINITIGAILATFAQYNVPGKLLRAIEWKTKFASTLNMKHGFQNPSLKLDKKFSLAAAKHIVTNPELIINDHIADAICLAAFPSITA